MRALRRRSRFAISGFAAIVLLLAGFSLDPALAEKPDWLKPKDPEESVAWAVKLPNPSDGQTLCGDSGGVYVSNDEAGVRVNVEKNFTGTKDPSFFYRFSFELTNQTERHVSFQNVQFEEEYYCADEALCCKFPACVGDPPCEPPFCMAGFLQEALPPPDYRSFLLNIIVNKESLGCEDLEDMPLDEPIRFVSGMDWFIFKVWNQDEFVDPATEYHNVECSERNKDDGNLENMNIWITRTAEDTWKITVEPENLFWVQETYTVPASGKSHGRPWKDLDTTVVPLQAKTPIYFDIDFIKINQGP